MIVIDKAVADYQGDGGMKSGYTVLRPPLDMLIYQCYNDHIWLILSLFYYNTNKN